MLIGFLLLLGGLFSMYWGWNKLNANSGSGTSTIPGGAANIAGGIISGNHTINGVPVP